MKTERFSTPSWKQSTFNALGVLSIIVGVVGFLPAGPVPVGNLFVGVLIWLGFTVLFIGLGILGLGYEDRKNPPKDYEITYLE